MPFPAPGDPLLAKRAELMRLYRGGKKPDPEVADNLRREIKQAELEAHVRKCLTDAPTLTTSQRQRIASILLGSA